MRVLRDVMRDALSLEMALCFILLADELAQAKLLKGKGISIILILHVI